MGWDGMEWCHAMHDTICPGMVPAREIICRYLGTILEFDDRYGIQDM